MAVDTDATELQYLNALESPVQITSFTNRENVQNTLIENPLRKQLLATCWCITGSLSFGISNGFTATLFPQIHDLTGNDKDTESWLASTVVISMILGVLFSGFLLRIFGRRRPLIICSLPWIFGWPIMTLINSLPVLYIGCWLVGLSSGLFSAISNVYVVEVTSAHTRAMIGVSVSIGVAVGIFFAHVTGIYLEWKQALLLSTIFPLSTFVLTFLSPESPAWLIAKGDLRKAQNIFITLRGNTEQTLNELNKLITKRKNDIERRSQGIIKNFLTKNFLLPLLITCLLFTAQQGSGINVITFYSISVLQKIFTHWDPKWIILLVDAVRIFSCIISVYFVKIVPRRTLFFVTALGTVLSLITIGYLRKYYILDEILLLLSMVAYMFFVYCGVLPIAWLMLGELYPDIVRDVGMSISTIYAFFCVLLVVKTGPLLIHAIEISNTLLLYSAVVATCAIILYFLMPETRNISLGDIGGKITNRP